PIQGPLHGTLEMSPTGAFTYLPDAGFSGVDVFTYTVNDGTGHSCIATVHISVGGNTAPVADVIGTVTTTHDVSVTVSPLAGALSNAYDPDGDGLTASVIVALHGTVTMTAEGGFTYTPAPGYVGTDAFIFQADDGRSASCPVMVNVQVVNSLPDSISNKTFSVQSGEKLYVPQCEGVLDSLVDADGDIAAAELLGEPGHGTLVVFNSDGSFVYTPDAGFAGQDRFTVRSTDGFAFSNVATITINVENALPVAQNDSYDVLYVNAQRGLSTACNNSGLADIDMDMLAGSRLVIPAFSGLLSNDSDDDYERLTVQILTQPAHSQSWQWASDGSFVYVPADGFVGTDVFTYQIFDGVTTSEPAIVTIQVKEDAPVARNDSYVVAMNDTLAVSALSGVLGNDYDLNGDYVTAGIVGDVPDGLQFNEDGTFAFTPGEIGTVTFHYVLSDGTLTSNDGVVTIQVVAEAVRTAPNAAPETYSLSHDGILSVSGGYNGVLANDSSFNNCPITAVLVTGPQHGTLVLAANGGFSYRPTSGYAGTDSFIYKADDGLYESSPVTVAIDVLNQATAAAADEYSIYANSKLWVSAFDGVLANDTDSEGDAVTATLIGTGPSHALSFQFNSDGSFVYQPAVNFHADDTFSYTVSDGASQRTANVTIHVTQTAPVARDDSYHTAAGGHLTVLAANGVLVNDSDADGDLLTAEIVDGPLSSQGTVTLVPAGGFVFQPAAGFTTATFTYRTFDGIEYSDPATVTITADVQAPVNISDRQYAVLHDRPLMVPVSQGLLAGVTAPDGKTLSVQVI
ncbi:MAG: tandem-95 repeat protein, partial [Planctomycetaceae bacterium]